jgi:hypothetical protein
MSRKKSGVWLMTARPHHSTSGRFAAAAGQCSVSPL